MKNRRKPFTKTDMIKMARCWQDGRYLILAQHSAVIKRVAFFYPFTIDDKNKSFRKTFNRTIYQTRARKKLN